MRYGVTEKLGYGAEKAISARNLSSMLGVTDRALRKIIEHERNSGAVILSDNGGYYLPSQDESAAIQEMKQFIRRSDARLKSNRQSVRSAKEKLHAMTGNQIYGQENLFNG